MRPYAELVLVILLPTTVGYGVIGLVREFRWAGERRRRRARNPEPEPMERLAAHLRRLNAELEDLENRTGVPAKNQRLQALRGAYMDALGTARERPKIGPPLEAGPRGGGRTRQAETYRVEAALRQRGLDVREPASR